MNINEIIITYGNNPKKMVTELLEEARLCELLPKNAKIGIKPNLCVAKPANTGATTSPLIIKALIEYLLANDFKDIVILEGSWIGDDTRRAYKICGYEDITKEYGIALFDTKSDNFITKEFNGLSMEISQKALELDFLINVPVLKGHCQTTITCAMKNLKGCISDKEKRRFHTIGLHKPIAYLNKLLPQHFILVDGLCGDLDFEEGGNPVLMNRIFCARDPVLADSYTAVTMGYEPLSIDYIKFGQQLSIGNIFTDKSDITVLSNDSGVNIPSPSGIVKRLTKNVVDDHTCSACFANLVHGLNRMSETNGWNKLKDTPIYIGQGFRGKAVDGIGIGNCLSGASCYAKNCPPSAKDILEFLHKIF